jgi:hypothetical protein
MGQKQMGDDESQRKSLAQPHGTRLRNGSSPLYSCLDRSLLASMGLSVDLHGHVDPDLALSQETRPVPALDFRFGRSAVPLGGVAGDRLVVIGFYFISRVYRDNTFTSATSKVTKDQKVVAIGPYAIVRHPLYASASLYLLGTPLALGSYGGLVAFRAMMPFLLWRLDDEEHFLATNLPGYTKYQKRVRHRLVPFVW